MGHCSGPVGFWWGSVLWAPIVYMEYHGCVRMPNYGPIQRTNGMDSRVMELFLSIGSFQHSIVGAYIHFGRVSYL